MASIEIPISDDKILDHLRTERGLQEGKTFDIDVMVEARPPERNSSVSHVVTVQLRYGLQLGEIERLVEF